MSDQPSDQGPISVRSKKNYFSVIFLDFGVNVFAFLCKFVGFQGDFMFINAEMSELMYMSRHAF